MRYTVVKTNVIDPDITSAEWQRAELGEIAANRWNEYAPAPKTTFRMLRGPEGISVMMHTEEKDLKCECDVENGNVFMDSCMEFFAAYDNTNPAYLNIEANSIGTTLAQLGTDRYDRVPADEFLGGPVTVQAEVGADSWSLLMHVTLEDLKKLYKMDTSVFVPGYSFRANLYKCGDETAVEHYNMWNPVGTPNPDYHQSSFFGKMTLEA